MLRKKPPRRVHAAELHFDANRLKISKNMGKNPKRHHFLPKSYLEGFSRDGYVWLYDRERREYRRQQPLNTAVIGNFYVFENTRGEKDYSLETFFSKIEGNAKLATEKLDAGNTLLPEDRLHLAYFISLLMVRSPKFDRVTQEVADAAMKQIIKHAIPSVEAAGVLVSQYENQTEENRISAESMFDFIHKERFKIEVPRNTVISIMLDQTEKVAFEVAMMDWLVVHPHPSSSFITTDEPIGFILPDELRKTGEPVLGLASQKVVKCVPLSRSVGLLLGQFGGSFGHRGLHRDNVRTFNRMVASECDRYVIGRDEALVRSIVKQSKVDIANPGTRMKVEHVCHSDDPNGTFIVTRRVLPDDADKPAKAILGDQGKIFPERFSLLDNQNAVFDLEKLLRNLGMEIPPKSPLEDASTAIIEMLELYKDKGIQNKKMDCRARWRQGLFLADIARKVLRAQSKPDFKNLILHLKLLLEPSNFSQFSAVSVSASPKEKEINNKVFELLVGVVLFQICSNLRFDHPVSSRGGNPDVIGEYKGEKWGFACKVSHSEHPATFLERVREGIEQIERADVDRGFVVVNLKNLIPHDIIWPAKRHPETGDWAYGSFLFRDGPAEILRILFEKWRYEIYKSLGGYEPFVEQFRGKKAVPLILVLYCSVAGYTPKSGIVAPMIVKRTFGLGEALEKLPNGAKEIAHLFNDFLHDKITPT